MRVTFVQPLQGTKFGFTKILRVEPLGMECVSSALQLHDHDTQLVDLRLDTPKQLWSHLDSWRPGAIGVACGFTSDVYTSLETARFVKKALPEAMVFAGGHHASLIPGDLLFPGSPFDAVVVGEGEWPTLDLIDSLEDGGEVEGIPGIMTNENLGGAFVSREIAADLDDLPLPDRELSLRYRRWYHHGFRVPSACVETTRGCPFNCNFCSIWVFYQRRARRFSTDRILADLEQVRRLDEENVFFTDDIAFLQRESYEELGEGIRRAGLELTYACETRADLVVKYGDLFKQWKDLGMHLVFLGIEKMDDDGLDAVRKRLKGGSQTNLEAIQILQDYGISPLTSLIADPGWGDEEFDRLEKTVKVLELPNPGFTVLTPLPGTELWETVKSKITTDDYAYFDVLHLVLPSKLPPERFYERIARLYQLTEVNTQLSWSALGKLAKMALRGQSFAMRRVLGAVRDMRSPKGYLQYPGSIPKPEWVPPGFGSTDWVDRGRSPLAEKVAEIAEKVAETADTEIKVAVG